MSCTVYEAACNVSRYAMRGSIFPTTRPSINRRLSVIELLETTLNVEHSPSRSNSPKHQVVLLAFQEPYISPNPKMALQTAQDVGLSRPTCFAGNVGLSMPKDIPDRYRANWGGQ